MRLIPYFTAAIFLMILTAFLVGGCSNPENIPPAGFSLTPSPVKVIFTDPQFRVEGSHGKTGTSDPYTKRLMNLVGLDMLEMSDLIRYIDNTQATIDLCTTRIHNEGMVSRLVNLANRGVAIRIVTEDAYFNDVNAIPLIQQLLDAGVLIRTDEDGYNRLMHQRYWIIDSRFVLCGSGDMLDATFTRSANNTLIFDTPKTINTGSDVSMIESITDAFFFDFTQMFDRGKFGWKKETMLKHTFKIGVDVEIYFGPNDDPQVRLRDQLANIDDNMFYAINQFTDGLIRDRIEELVQAGTYPISGVFDGPSNASVPPNAVAYDFPNMNGMNHKFMVVDVPMTFEDMQYFNAATSNDPVVLTGSCNWTNAGFNLNDETLVVVHDMTLGYRYVIGEANALIAAAGNSGVVYGEVRSAYNNVGLETSIFIESERVSSYFPGTDQPVDIETDPENEGFYGAYVTTGELFRLECTQPEGHLIPEDKFLYGATFLLLPGASYEGNFFPKLAPSGTGTGGT